MKISIVMIDGSFREKFHCVDSFLAQDFPKDEYEILWVEYYDSVNAELRSKECDNFKIITLDNAKSKEYHSSFCFNGGIKEAKGELIVIPDADVLVEKYFLSTVWDGHEECESLAMYFHRINEWHKKHNSEKSYSIDFIKDSGTINFSSNFGGCISVRKKWLLEVNGYDEDEIFSSNYHANDTDLNIRLKNIGLHIKWHPTLMLYHPWHTYEIGMSDKTDLQRIIVQKRSNKLTTLPNSGLDKNILNPCKDFLTSKEARKSIRASKIKRFKINLYLLYKKFF